MIVFLFEDNEEDLNHLRKSLSQNYELIVANSIEKSIEIIKNCYFDIAILDVFIEGKPKGIQLGNILNTLETKKPFIFLTSSLDRTIFDLAKFTKPNSYLIKPFNPIELQYAIELALEEFTNQPAAFTVNNGITLHNYIFVKSNKTISKVRIEDIIYVETESNYCSLITGDHNFLIKVSLQKLLEETLKSQFIRVHRNFAVNVDKIKNIYLKDNLVVMGNGEKIILSHRFKNQFIKSMNLFQ